MDKTRATEILTALAEGIDPFTGEVFPEDSPYNNIDTVRALYFAVNALNNIKQKKQPIEGMENKGKPWDEQEDEALKSAFLDGLDIESLAIEHKRTKGAIESRLKKHRFIDQFGKRIVHAPK